MAHETEANFFAVNGPEIIHKFYGESEAHLRKIFDEATRQGAQHHFPRRDRRHRAAARRVVGDVEKRVVAQLLALMDGLSQRQHVIVLAATNLPNALDPALRRPGRFDREISIPIPDQHGRAGDPGNPQPRHAAWPATWSIGRLAAITHGFVGADLEALCREAGMIALRRLLPQVDFSQRHMPYELLAAAGSDDGRLPRGLARSRAVGHPRGVRRSAQRQLGRRGGLEDVKQRLREAVEWPMKYAELFRVAALSPPKGAAACPARRAAARR